MGAVIEIAVLEAPLLFCKIVNTQIDFFVRYDLFSPHEEEVLPLKLEGGRRGCKKQLS